MKINCGPTKEERISALMKWHAWFAWFPVRIGAGDCRWLERIERKGYGHAEVEIWYWEYRLPGDDA